MQYEVILAMKATYNLLKCAALFEHKYAEDHLGLLPSVNDEAAKRIQLDFEPGDLVELMPDGIKATYINVAPWVAENASYTLMLGRNPTLANYTPWPTNQIKLLKKKHLLSEENNKPIVEPKQNPIKKNKKRKR